jgi:predicted DCC family thiol-disulfide oxidoreductase YuxK
VRRHYLSIDPRSLGLGRIALALVLLLDLLRRVPGLTLWYSNQGLLPNHTVLWRPPTRWMFSLFFMASWPHEAAVGFVLVGLCYLGLLLGWRTRLMQALSLVGVVSLHGRVPFLEDGGDWILAELALWTAFLPLGRRFSVDAVRASLRRRREHLASDLDGLDARAALASDAAPVVSFAALALLLQLADIFLLNALQKGGPGWRTGTAVHDALYQERIVTWLGAWLRPHLSLGWSRALSWAALATEAALPALLLAPFRVARRLAIAAIIGLHVGFQLFINLGVFTPALLAYTPFLLAADDWTWLRRALGGRARRLTAYFDADCGVCFQLARLFARLDRFARVRFVSSAEAPTLPAGITRQRLTETMVVVDEDSASVATRADGVARLLAALPLGWLWSWPLRVPGLRALANVAYDAFARRRHLVSYGLGLAVCGVPGSAPAPSRGAASAAGEPAPARVALRTAARALREAAVAALLVVLVSETLSINRVVPAWLKPPQPVWLQAAVAYPRLIQDWSMFAPDVPRTDQNVVVDAVTVDGRHVDPYSEVASRLPNPGRNEIPARLDNNSLFFGYATRIPYEPAYFRALEAWILAYPERTKRPQDRVVSFDAVLVEDDSPPPGETASRNARSRVFLHFPSPK